MELSQPNNQYNRKYKYQRKLCEYWVIQSVLLRKCEMPMLKIKDNSKVFLHFAGLFYIAKCLYCLTYIESLFFPLTLRVNRNTDFEESLKYVIKIATYK